MITFDILTLFPDFFLSPLKESLLGKAQEKGIIRVRVHDIRDYAHDKHSVTDDYPFGGGAGMVLKPEPVVEALESVRADQSPSRTRVLLTPQGVPFSQSEAFKLSRWEQIVLLCGRYEGVDERIRYFVDQEISIGDYILNGGESAALVILEAVTRLIPGVLGKPESITAESFSDDRLEYPQYTRPRDFRGLLVPEVLLSGNHQEIQRWRVREALKRTWLRRPDLLVEANLAAEEQALLEDIQKELTRLKDDGGESFRTT